MYLLYKSWLYKNHTAMLSDINGRLVTWHMMMMGMYIVHVEERWNSTNYL